MNAFTIICVAAFVLSLMSVSSGIHKPLSVHDHNTSNGVHIVSINIRCLLAHIVELEAFLKLHRPRVVLLQETWLKKSYESISISAYIEVSQRDRKSSDNRKGIVTFQRHDFNCLVHIRNCNKEERSYHFMRLGLETILVANWYRPGATVHDGFTKLYDEIRDHYKDISGVIISGDLNVHHRKWLKFSNDNTTVGADLKAFSDYFGLWQLVREPTRNQYLLDLVLSDVQGGSTTVLKCITDHKAVLLKLPIAPVLETSFEREVWHLKGASWSKLQAALAEFDWKLNEGTAEEALLFFLENLWYHLVLHIPRRKICSVKRSHPWLNDRSMAAIQRKNDAEGSEQFDSERAKCMQVLGEEKARYVDELKTKIANLPKSSKAWWRLNRELLHRKAKLSSIPTLKEDNTWISDPKAKADSFACTFVSK